MAARRQPEPLPSTRATTCNLTCTGKKREFKRLSATELEHHDRLGLHEPANGRKVREVREEVKRP